MYVFRISRGKVFVEGLTLADVVIRQRFLYINQGSVAIAGLRLRGCMLSATFFGVESGGWTASDVVMDGVQLAKDSFFVYITAGSVAITGLRMTNLAASACKAFELGNGEFTAADVELKGVQMSEFSFVWCKVGCRSSFTGLRLSDSVFAAAASRSFHFLQLDSGDFSASGVELHDTKLGSTGDYTFYFVYLSSGSISLAGLHMANVDARESEIFFSEDGDFSASDVTITNTTLISDTFVVKLKSGSIALSGARLNYLAVASTMFFSYHGGFTASNLEVTASDFSGYRSQQDAAHFTGFVYVAKLTEKNIELRGVLFDFITLRKNFNVFWVHDGDGNTLVFDDVVIRHSVSLGATRFVQASANTQVNFNGVVIEDNQQFAPESGFPYAEFVRVIGDKNNAPSATMTDVRVANNVRLKLLFSNMVHLFKLSRFEGAFMFCMLCLE